jgi:hypothetical protein
MKTTYLLTNEKGSVVVLALIMLVLLTLLGMAVTRTSSIEVQIASNDNRATDCFYTAESADHYAIEASNGWLTNAFLNNGQLAAQVIIGAVDTDSDGIDDSFTFDTDGDGIDDVTFDMDGDGVNDANFDIDGDGINDKIEIRCIEVTGGTHGGNLSVAANDLPVMQHITIPPIGSGYSLKYFEVRKYGITGTASSGCSRVQIGAYKVFNKF